MNKKTKIAIIGIIALILVTIGITYAYWLITRTQEGENVITTGCLDITLTDGADDITLTDQFPMSDEDGANLTPYTFTVTNNCNTSVDYQVALEALGDESTAIKSSALKVALDDTSKLFSAYKEVNTTIEGAYESRLLDFARLSAKGNEGSSETYNLRIWINKNAPISEMNKTFRSKISVTIGQGIESPYEEGTLAYEILANLGGTNDIEEIAAEKYINEKINTTSLDLSAQSYFYGTDYTVNSSSKYKLAGDIVQATLAECRAGKKSDGTEITCGKYTLRQTTSTATFQALFEITNWQTSGNYVSVNGYNAKTEFTRTTPTTGIFKTQDDLGDSYYFRGSPTNNYVEFGTYTNDIVKYQDTYNYNDYDTLEECEAAKGVDYPPDEMYEPGNGIQCEEAVYARQGSPMYWQIVRINGDGTIRLVYNGMSKANSSVSNIGKSQYNSSYEGYQYVGYTYDVDGTQTDSVIKSVVDSWYNTNLKESYGEYISDGIFCNDRSGDGQGSYNASSRTLNPSLKCLNKSDRYSLNENIGNGLLSNPVGLLSYDEYVFAGGDKLKVYMGYRGYWTLTPYEGSNMKITGTNSDGETDVLVSEYFRVRPVINLKIDVEFTGNGTTSNPYKIVTN